METGSRKFSFSGLLFALLLALELSFVTDMLTTRAVSNMPVLALGLVFALSFLVFAVLGQLKSRLIKWLFILFTAVILLLVLGLYLIWLNTYKHGVYRDVDKAKAQIFGGKKVMVIGGGDTGNDCVGTSIRHGAKSVVQLEMMPKAPDQRAASNPWPEWPRVCKTDYGQQEAIAVFGADPRVYTTTVKEFIKDKKGKLCKAVLVKLESKKDEKTGRMRMEEIPGSEYTVAVDLVLIAAGFLGSQDYVTKAFGVEINERTNVKTEPGRYATNVKNVFTAGDMHRGQSLVVWAIREGREVAREIDESLMGYTNLNIQ